MPLKIFNSGGSEAKQQNIDIRETFAIWEVLSYKYMGLERVLLWENFTHDPDLKLIFRYEKKQLQKNIDILERLMEEYSVPSPDKNRAALDAPIKADVITDKFIAADLFLYVQESIEGLLTAFRGSLSNDKIRAVLRDFLIKKLEGTDNLIKYMALRGFIGVVPPYKHLPPDSKESLSCAEAGNLWDHLTYRYDNIHTSETFKLLIHDKDFKVTVDMGISLLVEQAKLLERELKKFGIPFPQKPGNVTFAADLKTIEDDVHLFRIAFMGIQGATMLHAKSFKQCTVNNRIRSLFKRLLIDEVEKMDDYIRFGKFKGWLSPVPLYGP